METQKVIAHIVGWLKEYCTNAHQKGFVIGISGGIDSAVTSALCARTGFPVLCVEMPIHQAASQVSRGQEHIVALKKQFPLVSSQIVDLTPTFDTIALALPKSENDDAVQLALANTRARLRMTTLYYLAGLHGYLVAGTGNKVEDFGVGFFTKYGDGGVDLSPIADLNKTEIYTVARALGIVESVQKAAPTDGLFGDDRTDADQIGASYPELELAMEHVESGNSDLSELSERERVVMDIYKKRHRANLHKMDPIPVCEIPLELKN
ncbi:MAG: NAD(+) synthase [Flavobacteriales bacterium]|nr:NAD(+) synthase [Flavobacteriales bacterium]MBK6943828.1 NAD(+) synthase [Flavobacteriales bacterium]MBK7240038.1 NAD(+) synthase [Flavobacteriales bacterium]MBK7297087.1 NAD(+) synthase [Flavobacteriales bacterium]MBK9535640.1 NAD(+) synthase [Flavobacteriales bacterium]